MTSSSKVMLVKSVSTQILLTASHENDNTLMDGKRGWLDHGCTTDEWRTGTIVLIVSDFKMAFWASKNGSSSNGGCRACWYSASTFGSSSAFLTRKKATVANSWSECMTVSTSELFQMNVCSFWDSIGTYRAIRCRNRGQSRVRVSYSPPSPHICAPYKSC